MQHLQGTGKKGKYITAAIGVLAGYVLFLTSKLWFPGQSNASDYTQLGSQIMVGDTDTSVSLVYWAYAKKQAAMSVELDVQAGMGIDLDFLAVDKAMDQLPVTCMLQESGTVVLKISDIPEDFGAISLRVVEGKEQARLYTNLKQVDQVEKLTFYTTLDGYYQARITRNIEAMGQDIKEQQDLLLELDVQITGYKEQIKQTTARLPYLRKSQRITAEDEIQALEKQIENCKEKQQVANDTISELTSEMEKQQQLKNGKVYETLHEEVVPEANVTLENDTQKAMEERQ